MSAYNTVIISDPQERQREEVIQFVIRRRVVTDRFGIHFFLVFYQLITHRKKSFIFSLVELWVTIGNSRDHYGGDIEMPPILGLFVLRFYLNKE